MSEKDIKKNEVPQNRDKEFLADPWARTRTRNGLAADEVISALQKSIRKGKERANGLLIPPGEFIPVFERNGRKTMA